VPNSETPVSGRKRATAAKTPPTGSTTREDARTPDSGAAVAPGTWQRRIVGQGDEAPDQLLANPLNWRVHPRVQQDALRGVLREVGLVQQVVVNTQTGHLVDGHLRVQLALQEGQPTVPVLYVDLTEAEEHLVLATLDPIAALATADKAVLDNLLDGLEAKSDAVAALLQAVASGGTLRDFDPYAPDPSRAGALVAAFGVPPFTVLDARQGYWQERKRAWLDLGARSEPGKEYLPNTTTHGSMVDRGAASSGGSSFDPVLAELVLRWFCPPGGDVLDPTAGEAVKGIVAGTLGYHYTGIELRPEQVEANADACSAMGLVCTWLVGDSVERMTQPEWVANGPCFDLVFTSPPYYDLEVYSGRGKDSSAMGSYEDFMTWMEAMLGAADALLRPDRFAVLKLGDVRDKAGAYRGFVADTIAVARRLGWHLYNDAVLITPVGSLPVRAGLPFRASRKLSRGHQQVLVWYKGDLATLGDVHDYPVEHGQLPDAP
jgi:DNA modification methylase